MKIVIALLLLSVFSIKSNAQSGIQKFLVAEYRVDSPVVGRVEYLTSYNFKNGEFLSKDTLLATALSKRDDSVQQASYISSNIIYKNKYLITKYGNLIDLKAKKILWQPGDTFIKGLGDTLIYHRDNVSTGTGYLALNLKTGAYSFIKENSWYVPRFESSSPDNSRYLTIDKSKFPYKVCLNDRAGNSRILVSDAKVGPLNKLMYKKPSVETYWLDNNIFLYVVHHRKKDVKNQWYHQVDLRKYNLKDSSDQLFYSLDSIPQGFYNGYFKKNEVGELIYLASSGDTYLVDTDAKKLHQIKEHERAHGFSVKYGSAGYTFKYKNKEIGTHKVFGMHVHEGIVATQFRSSDAHVPSKEAGVMFWSAKTIKWMSFKVPWISSIVGWWVE